MEQALPAAWAIELFHNFTLLHDDIMDAAPLRRGKPTVHTKWNTTTGILSGNVLLIWAYRHLMWTSPPQHPRPPCCGLLTAWPRKCAKASKWIWILNAQRRVHPGVHPHNRAQNSQLLGGAMEMGALCAGAGNQTPPICIASATWPASRSKIQDDLLQSYGDPDKFGKQVGGDILQNKKTYLVLKTLETAPEADCQALQQWLRSSTKTPTPKYGPCALFLTKTAFPPS